MRGSPTERLQDGQPGGRARVSEVRERSQGRELPDCRLSVRPRFDHAGDGPGQQLRNDPLAHRFAVPRACSSGQRRACLCTGA